MTSHIVCSHDGGGASLAAHMALAPRAQWRYNAARPGGVAEGVRPEQIEVPSSVRFVSIRVEADGSRAAVVFSDGTEVTVRAEALYTQKG